MAIDKVKFTSFYCPHNDTVKWEIKMNASKIVVYDFIWYRKNN